MKRAICLIILIVALVGFLDATFLTIEHYRGVLPPCSILKGCEKVTTSSYSVIMGVPVALFGAFYYLVIFLLAVWYLDSGRQGIARVIFALSFAGLFASAWFVYLQFAVIHAICLYCMTSAATSTTIFLSGSFIRLEDRTNNPTTTI